MISATRSLYSLLADIRSITIGEPCKASERIVAAQSTPNEVSTNEVSPNEASPNEVCQMKFRQIKCFVKNVKKKVSPKHQKKIHKKKVLSKT